MKIGIDISILQRGGGVANYISHLLLGLGKTAPEHQDHLFTTPENKVHLPVESRSFTMHTSPMPTRLLQPLWLYLRFPPASLFTGRTHLFHSPAHSPVYALSPPAVNWVVTVHDLFTFKLHYPASRKRQEERALKLMEASAAKVITVSHATRNDLLEMCSASATKTVVIHEGVDESFFPDHGRQRFP